MDRNVLEGLAASFAGGELPRCEALRESRLAGVYRVTHTNVSHRAEDARPVFAARSRHASLVAPLKPRGDSGGDIVAVLRAQALDDEIEHLFAQSTIAFANAGILVARACASDGDDAFESQIFEVFETASRISYGRRQRSPKSSLRAQRIKRYIEQRLSEALTLDGIAATVGISPFALIRQFRDATGMTPYVYLSRCRAAQAKSLLRCTNKPIEEVGRIIGIHDPNYFSRFFKRNAGMAPSHYRLLSKFATNAGFQVAPPSSEYCISK